MIPMNILSVSIRDSVGDPDPDLFAGSGSGNFSPDPDPGSGSDPLKVLIIYQKRWFLHNIFSTLAFHQTMKKTSELLVKTTVLKTAVFWTIS
jgi:hypothetical protein